MSKFDEAIDAAKAQLEKCGVRYDEALLIAITKSLGPSLYNKDANLVAAGDKDELDTIRQKLIADKLGVEVGDGNKAIEYAIETLGSSNRQKLRPVFYYLVVTKLGKESVYA